MTNEQNAPKPAAPPSVTDADTVVTAMVEAHPAFREWWNELPETTAQSFMDRLAPVLAPAPLAQPEVKPSSDEIRDHPLSKFAVPPTEPSNPPRWIGTLAFGEGSDVTTQVTDEMVERALSAPYGAYSVSSFIPLKSPHNIRELMRAALEAALTHPGHKHAQEDAAQEGAIPARVYYSVEHDNFYCNDTLKGMGTPFYMKWHARRREFPTLRSEGDTE